jgi:hypothetical protein
VTRYTITFLTKPRLWHRFGDHLVRVPHATWGIAKCMLGRALLERRTAGMTSAPGVSVYWPSALSVSWSIPASGAATAAGMAYRAVSAVGVR